MDTVPVNDAPQYIMGLINYGGYICPVVSICRDTAFLPPCISAKSCFIMVKASQKSKGAVGIMADAFLGSFGISNSEIKPCSPDFFTAAWSHVKGTSLCRHGTAAVLEPEELFKCLDWIEI
jgi:chemotaxis signal transduction protein